MELKVQPYQQPEQITFNYEELKGMLLEKAAHYEAIVYNEEQIATARADKANLNKLKKALNDERIRREKEYMESFNVFKAQIAEIIGIIDKPCAVIDKQIKAFEEKTREEKLAAITEEWNERLQADKIPEGISFKCLFNEKWLNASVKMPAIRKEIDQTLERVASDLGVISTLPYFSFEAKEMYLETLDLAKAISEAHRLQAMAERKAAAEAEQAKAKAEAEAKAAEREARAEEVIATVETVEEPREWVRFQAYMSVSEAKALGAYMREHGIQYKSV